MKEIVVETAAMPLHVNSDIKRERRVMAWHGEGMSVFYVMIANPLKDEEWDFEASFAHRDLAEAYKLQEDAKEGQ